MISEANRAKIDPQVARRKTRYTPGGELLGLSSEERRTTTSAVFSARSLTNRGMLPSYALTEGLRPGLASGAARSLRKVNRKSRRLFRLTVAPHGGDGAS